MSILGVLIRIYHRPKRPEYNILQRIDRLFDSTVRQFIAGLAGPSALNQVGADNVDEMQNLTNTLKLISHFEITF